MNITGQERLQVGDLDRPNFRGAAMTTVNTPEVIVKPPPSNLAYQIFRWAFVDAGKSISGSS